MMMMVMIGVMNSRGGGAAGDRQETLSFRFGFLQQLLYRVRVPFLPTTTTASVQRKAGAGDALLHFVPRVIRSYFRVGGRRVFN